VKIIDNISEIIDSSSRKDDILISVAEACINAIEHGNQLTIDLDLTVEFVEYRTKYAIRIYDNGEGYLHYSIKPDIKVKVMEDLPRGLGLYLIDTFTDEVNTGFKDNDIFYIELIYYKEKN